MKLTCASVFIILGYNVLQVQTQTICPAGQWNIYTHTGRNTCADCTNSLPANAHFLTGQFGPTCQWECNSGWVKSILGGLSCDGCPGCNSGYYVAATCRTGQPTTCAQCLTCSSGQYQKTACTQYANAECQACSSCPSGKYQKTACGSTTDTVCQPCTTCSSEKYQKTACGVSTDTVCQKCTSCSSEKYQKTACGTSADTICATCATCLSGKYQKTACGTSADTICEKCATCSSGKYQKTACKGVTDTDCQPCTVCTPDQYQQQPCGLTTNTICLTRNTTCGLGNYISWAGNATSNIQCSPCIKTCPFGMYMSVPPTRCTGTTTLDVVAPGCTPCPSASECVPGSSFFNKICYGNETQRPTCDACTDPVPPCNPESQWIMPCTLAEDRKCKTFDACPSGHFSTVVNNTVEVCRECTLCVAKDLRELQPCKVAGDAVCAPRQCTEVGQCGLTDSQAPVFCDFNTQECGVCPRGYSNNARSCIECPMGYSCDFMGIPVCKGECPVGYNPNCDSGRGLSGFVTCTAQSSTLCAAYDPNTTVVTRGSYVNPNPSDCYPYFECKPGYVKYFNNIGVAWCEACYPQSKPAYAKWTSNGLDINNRASCLWECDPAISEWDEVAQACFLHHRPLSTNQQGWVGNNSATCHIGFTSEAGRAWDSSQCVPCPTLPDYATWVNAILCTWKCVSGTKNGGMCTRVYSTCRPDMTGVSMMDGVCKPTPLPWQAPGFYKTGVSLEKYTGHSTFGESHVFSERIHQTMFRLFQGDWATIRDDMVCWLTLQNSTVVIKQQYVLCNWTLNPSNLSVSESQSWWEEVFQVSSGLNATTNASNWSLLLNQTQCWMTLTNDLGQTNQASLGCNWSYDVKNASLVNAWWTPVISTYESTYFANKGGFRMTAPGMVCSLTLSKIQGVSWVFFTFCGQSYVSYRNLDDLQEHTYTLIGNATSGWREGFKTEALFGSELYVTSGLSPYTLYVLDTRNCLLREITIDFPGSYRTRSSTVYGLTKNLDLLGLPTCYGTGGLAYPRNFWPGLSPYVFFFDNQNTFQLNLATNEVSALLGDGVLPGLVGEPDVSMASYFSLSLNGYTVTATVERCPSETTSLAGSECNIPCPWLTVEGIPGHYVDQSTGVCTPCTAIVCGLGYQYVACTASLPPQCKKCPTLEPLHGKYNRTYLEAATCDLSSVGFVPPCPKGYYANEKICTKCPDFSTTLADGANQIAMCVCVEGMTLISDTCYPGRNGRRNSLYPILEPNSCGFGKYYRDKTSGCAQCQVPPCLPCSTGNYSTIDCICKECDIPLNAQATSNGLQVNLETSCEWQCNPGFYPSSAEIFEDRCRPCTNLLPGKIAITHGALDSPLSCIVV